MVDQPFGGEHTQSEEGQGAPPFPAAELVAILGAGSQGLPADQQGVERTGVGFLWGEQVDGEGKFLRIAIYGGLGFVANKRAGWAVAIVGWCARRQAAIIGC